MNLNNQIHSIKNDYEVIAKELSTTKLSYEDVKHENTQLTSENLEYKENLEENIGLLQSKATKITSLSNDFENLSEDLQLKTKEYEDLQSQHHHLQDERLKNIQDLTVDKEVHNKELSKKISRKKIVSWSYLE